jgi:phasin protein
MSGSERLDSKAGPLGNLSQAYFGGLDMMVKGYEPALKGVGRWNLEVLGFMARRAQAWFEIPTRLRQCKTPVDLFNEQGRFWQTAAADYTDGSKRLAAAWSACAAMPKLNGAQPRDYITFPEPQEAPAVPKRDERKAA